MGVQVPSAPLLQQIAASRTWGMDDAVLMWKQEGLLEERMLHQ